MKRGDSFDRRSTQPFVSSNETPHVLLVTFPCSLILIPCSSRAIPCLPISNSLLFRNRELPSNHLRYRWLPRQKRPDQPQKWPKFPVNSLFFPVIDGFQPRPDSSKLPHPPPSLPNCGTAETDEISAPLARFCSIRCHQRRARRAERASFLGFVSNRDFRVPRLRPVGERALTGPCSVGKEATRGVQN